MKKTIQRSIGLGRVKIKAKNLKIIPPPPPLPPNQKKKLLDSVDDEQDNEEEPTGSPFDPCEDDEDESTLLFTQPRFNKLLLVLRDERVMRFVKYVSAAAPGSRWDSDICGEYEVGR